jgi:hypothetical protein
LFAVLQLRRTHVMRDLIAIAPAGRGRNITQSLHCPCSTRRCRQEEVEDVRTQCPFPREITQLGC